MTEHTHIAKITRPRLSEVLPRMRLFCLLDQNRCPITWVSGPPGSGKTTLVASYLDNRKLPCIWYQIDECDGDIATFFYYMGRAGKKAAPKVKRPLPLLTPEYRLGVATFTRRFFENLFNRLKPPFVLALDDYQEAPENSSLHEAVVNGLSVLPPGVTAFIMSRMEPHPVFARMEANKLMGVIGWEQLRLTPEETSSMMQLLTGKPASQESLQKLYEKTSGWAVGVVLMEALQARGGQSNDLETMEPGKLSDYFDREIFDNLREEVREFLLKTAHLPRITLRMAESISGNSRAGQILAELNRRNYFTERREEPEISYQYHTLFREFLERKAEEEYSEEVRIELRLAGAKLLEEAGRIEDAAELFTKVRDWKGLTRLVLMHAHSLTAQGRSRTLEGWISPIPHEITEDDPCLLYWLGISMLHYRPKESNPLFERAYDLFNKAGDAAGVFLSWSGVVDSIQFQSERLSRLDHWLEELQQAMKRYKSIPNQEIEIRVAISMFAALNTRKPHHPDALKWRERMISLTHQNGDENLQSLAAFYASLHELFVGNPNRSASILRPFEKTAKRLQSTVSTQIMIKMLSTAHCWLQGLDEQCQKSVSEAKDLADRSGVHVWDCLILGTGATGAMNSGDMKRAEELLQCMEARLPQSSEMDKSFYYYLASWHAVLQLDLSTALEFINIGLESAERVEIPFPLALNLIAAAVICHELKKYDDSAGLFKRAWRIAVEMNSPTLLLLCNLAAAQFAFDREKESEGRNALEKAMAIGREHGFVNAYWWRKDVMARLCVKALECGIEPEYVQGLIRKRNLMPENLPWGIDAWPWPIKIYTFGRFEIIKDGKPLEFSRKVQKKPLQLLKALLAAEGNEVHEDRLTYLIWPDAVGDAGHKDLSMTVNRLRKLLGTGGAVVVKGGRISLDSRFCWVDTSAFEHVLEQAHDARKRSKASLTVQLLHKALDLYNGPFLVDDPDPWSVSLREKLRNKLLHSIDDLGACMEQSKAYEEALRMYQRGLAVDNLAETFYQRMMVCYQKLGRCAEALSLYQCCKNTLAAYDIKPSPETEAIRDSLHGQE